MLLSVTLNCNNNKEQPENLSPEQFLPQTLKNTNAVRSSEIRVFHGDSLWQYINGGADLYHLYNFVEVATADYKINTAEITIDIYRFDNNTNAYGLYTAIRPGKARLLSLGVEGFVSAASLKFVKGSFVISLTGYDESKETSRALSQAASNLNELIPGTINRPDAFALFPEENQIRSTDMYSVHSFLGRKTLTRIYSQRYLLESDTVTLFLSFDKPHSKLQEWSRFAAGEDKKEKVTSDLPFDDDKAFITHDAYYGRIIAGLRKGKLVGMVGYSEKCERFFADWLQSLP